LYFVDEDRDRVGRRESSFSHANSVSVALYGSAETPSSGQKISISSDDSPLPCVPQTTVAAGNAELLDGLSGAAKKSQPRMGKNDAARLFLSSVGRICPRELPRPCLE
jgi:hypothetical protein